MRAAAVEVADVVLLEQVAVDDDRLRRLPLRARFLPLGLVRVGVLRHEREAPAVGGPGEVLHPALHPGQWRGLAARGVEQPDLGLGLVVVLAPGGQERDPAAVRAPARMRVVLGAHGQAHVPGAVPTAHPDVARLLVPLEVVGRDDVGDPRAVRRDPGVGHRAHAGKVVEGDGALRRGLRRCGLGERTRGHEQDSGEGQGEQSHRGSSGEQAGDARMGAASITPPEDTPARGGVKAAEGCRVQSAGNAKGCPGGSAPEGKSVRQREACGTLPGMPAMCAAGPARGAPWDRIADRPGLGEGPAPKL